MQALHQSLWGDHAGFCALFYLLPQRHRQVANPLNTLNLTSAANGVVAVLLKFPHSGAQALEARNGRRGIPKWRKCRGKSGDYGRSGDFRESVDLIGFQRDHLFGAWCVAAVAESAQTS